MLGSGVLSVRLGGINTLVRLATDYPADYHIQVISLLCTLARQPPNDLTRTAEDSITDHGGSSGLRPNEDIQAIVWAVGDRSDDQREIEHYTEERFEVDLEELDFRWGHAERTDLSGTNLRYANLSMANLTQVDLSGAHLQYAELTRAILIEANLFDTKLWHANMHAADLSGANLWGAELLNTNLVTASLRGAELYVTDLSGADLENADLSSAELLLTDLSDTNLSGVDFSGARMDRVILRNANLSGAYLSRFGKNPVIGITQKQLDEAVADPDNPPKLASVTDVRTGHILKWKAGESRS